MFILRVKVSPTYQWAKCLVLALRAKQLSEEQLTIYNYCMVGMWHAELLHECGLMQEAKPHPYSLPCNIHRVNFENVKRLFGQSEAEKLGRSMTILIVTCILMFTPRTNHNPELYKYRGDMISSCLMGRNGKQDKEDDITFCLGV